MTDNSLANPQSLPPVIRRARFQTLTIYEVEESELSLLERGSPESIHLNFAIAFLTTAIALFAALYTATIPDIKTFTVFVVIAVVGLIAGVVLLCLWWRSRTSVRDQIATIRNRLPRDDAEPQQLA